MINPNTSVWKNKWDGFMIFILMLSCMSIPVRLAFESEDDGDLWRIL
jgi:hypothetical protein